MNGRTAVLASAASGLLVVFLALFAASAPQADAAADDVVSVRLWGETGTERARLRVDGQLVATRYVSTSATTWTVRTPVDSEVKVEFDNDATHNGRDRNLWVNWVEVNGRGRIQTESPEVHSTGTWSRSNGCGPGHKQSETLHCNGAFTYEFDGGGSNPTSCIGPEGWVRATPGQCVGVPDEQQLTNYRSSMRDTDVYRFTQDGQVIEGKRFVGCVVIEARNVTFRNNHVECYASRDVNNSPGPYPGNNGPVLVASSAANATVEHNTLVCRKKSVDVAPCDFGVYLWGPDSVARYNDLYGMVDGFDPNNRATIEYNYIHDLSTAFEEWRNDYSHADGVQMYMANSGGLVIKGNHFRGRPSQGGERDSGLQGVLIQRTSGVSGRAAIQIENNLFEGFWPSLRIACVGDADCMIRNNTVDARYKSTSAVYLRGNTSSDTRVICNRFTDGSLIQSSHVDSGSADNRSCS